MAITTSMTTSAKFEFMMAGHCFAAPVTITGSATSGATFITGLSSVVGVSVGMSITNANIPSGTTVVAIGSSTMTISKATTGILTGGSLVLAGDSFYCALIKAAPTGSYGPATTNYAQIVGNSDEVVGTGYTAGGVALTSVGPAIAGTTAIMSFANPSWTSATLSCSGCVIYNASQRVNATSGAVIATYDFGGVQTVSVGSFTIYFPPDVAGAAILQII